jgi:hypothetical protein
MKNMNKTARRDSEVERTMAKVRQLIACKDVREISLQSAALGTRFTIRTNTKVYDFWLPGASGLIAFSRVLQEVLTHGEGKAEHQETP